MADAKEYVRQEYVRLSHRRAEALEMLERVRRLLDRADNKRQSELEDVRKWNKVLDRLETALDQTRARLMACEREIDRQKRRAKRLGVEVPEAVDDPMEAAETIRLAAPLSEEEIDAQVREAASEALGDNSEAHSAFFGPVAKPESPGAHSERPSLKKRNDSGKSRAGLTLEERRHRKRLRVAVDKLLLNQFDGLTLREVDLLLDSALSAPESGDEEAVSRLRETLSKFLVSLENKLAAWNTRWGAASDSRR